MTDHLNAFESVLLSIWKPLIALVIAAGCLSSATAATAAASETVAGSADASTAAGTPLACTRPVHQAVFARLAHCNLELQALTGGNLSLSNKKQREIYVGNLTIGVVVDTMLRDLFNGALAHLVPDPVANPPVINAALDPSGVATLCASSLHPTRTICTDLV